MDFRVENDFWKHEELGNIPNGWKVVDLGDIYKFTSGLSKGAKDFGFGFPFLSYKDIFKNYFVPSKLIELANTTEGERKSCSIKRGDIFLTRTSETIEEIGMSCVALEDYENATFNGFAKRLRPNNKIKVVPEFAGYYFRSKIFRDIVSSYCLLTTRASLNNDILSALKFILPLEDDQKRIGMLLKSMDDKIESLDKQNKLLEDLGEKLFEKYFVRFEEYEGELIWNEELEKEVPTTWEVIKIEDEVNFIRGVEVGSKNYSNNGDKRFLRVGNLTGQRDELIFTDYKTNIFSNYNDILVSVDGSPGVVKIGLNGIYSTGIVKLLPKSDEYSKGLIYFFMKSKEVYNLINRYATGTTIKHAGSSISYIYFYKSEIINEKSPLFQNILNSIEKNLRQIETLTKLRDKLLPMLISGKIKV